MLIWIAWLPPLPGNQFPFPNIPVKMLKALNDNAESGDVANKNSTSEDESDSDDSQFESEIRINAGPTPVTGFEANAEDLSDSEPSSPPLSWSSSPEREVQPAFDDGLPPDSSFKEPEDVVDSMPHSNKTDTLANSSAGSLPKFETRSNGAEPNVTDSSSNNSAIHMPNLSLEDPILPDTSVQLLDKGEQSVDGLNESQVYPQAQLSHAFHSSPPTPVEQDIMMESGDSDNDLEIAVPQALGGDRDTGNMQSTQAPKAMKRGQGGSTRVPQIQVKETPWKNMQHMPPDQPTSSGSPRNSSGKSKTSSTSVIPCTYKDTDATFHALKDKTNILQGSQEVHSSTMKQTDQSPPCSDNYHSLKYQNVSSMPTMLASSKPGNTQVALSPFNKDADARIHSPQLVPYESSEVHLRPHKRRPNNSPESKRARQAKRLHFSQESPLSQDPSTSSRQQRREYFRQFGAARIDSDVQNDGRKAGDLAAIDNEMISAITEDPELVENPDQNKHVICLDSSPQQETLRRPPIQIPSSPGPSGQGDQNTDKDITIEQQSKPRLDKQIPSSHLTPDQSHNLTVKSRRINRSHVLVAALERESSSNMAIAESRRSLISNSSSPKERNQNAEPMQPPPRPSNFEAQSKNQTSAGIASPPTSTSTKTVFEKFKEAYPDYTGDLKHFLHLCRQIRDGRAKNIHKFLWDDFIIRNRMEYRDYLVRCGEDGDDPIPYQNFYNEQIEEPRFKNSIMNPSILQEALGGPSSKPSTPSRNPVRLPPSSIPTRRPPTSPAAMRRSPKRARRSLPWGATSSAPDHLSRPPPRRSLPSQPSQSRKPLSSSRHLHPRDSPHTTATNSAAEKATIHDGQIDNEGRWYEDPNTPFKEWMSQYQRLTCFTGQTGRPQGRDVVKPPQQKLDVLAWKL